MNCAAALRLAGNIRELRNASGTTGAVFRGMEPTPDLTPQFMQLLLPELARESAKLPLHAY